MSKRSSSEFTGLTFFDKASGREMKYVPGDSSHWTAGWLLYRHLDGQWLTLRKATGGDLEGLRSQIATTYGEHATDGRECWCYPDIEILSDGTHMITHRDVIAPKTGSEQ